MSRNRAEALQHPALLHYSLGNMYKRNVLKDETISLKSNSHTKSNLTPTKNGLQFYSGDKGYLDKEAEFQKEFLSVLTAIEKGKISRNNAKDVLKKFSKITESQVQAGIEIKLPDLPVKPGSALAFELISRDNLSGRIKGGITYIITSGNPKNNMQLRKWFAIK